MKPLYPALLNLDLERTKQVQQQQPVYQSTYEYHEYQLTYGPQHGYGPQHAYGNQYYDNQFVPISLALAWEIREDRECIPKPLTAPTPPAPPAPAAPITTSKIRKYCKCIPERLTAPASPIQASPAQVQASPIPTIGLTTYCLLIHIDLSLLTDILEP